MKKLSLIIASFALIVTLPLNSQASTENPDAYADSLLGSSANAFSPELALGAPDGESMSFNAIDSSAQFDLGEEGGAGNLILHMELIRLGARVNVEFKDANNQSLYSHLYQFEIDEPIVTIPYEGVGPYQYLTITSTEEEEWRLDAIEATSFTDTSPVEEIVEKIVEEVEETITVEPITAIPLTFVDQGFLIKIEDDGDASTTHDQALYILGADEQRHTFFNETIFFSWFNNFDDVLEIPAEQMASYPLGANVPVRSGTHLVKIESDPKVYAVENEGTLRWITTETIATSLYGDNWANRVIDIPASLFGGYTVGEPIYSSLTHPSGSVVISPNGYIYYARDSLYYTLQGTMVNDMHFQSRFYITLTEDMFALYSDGGVLENVSYVKWPF